ncbi:hypothetical protein B0J18DRAFT_415774 [Chaetomium sp. MPI-SDFR-AT-0129]|uniref:Uncharacterized protein n=1 Tax=Dichotomopilus funicola TaxID=1934379 RepID=A0AAN6VAF8_9PEZI|nr:hypothetical protein B0J18DRAFT_415774 [Chaetomium sp. MPI-SDFR-AT-0129]KAK4147715.1 hypothetical protein C8A04DRAFT_24263 [Dichotomopilus funicola]
MVYCDHYDDYTCMNTVTNRGDLCSDCSAGKCGQTGKSCSKNRKSSSDDDDSDSDSDDEEDTRRRSRR